MDIGIDVWNGVQPRRFQMPTLPTLPTFELPTLESFRRHHVGQAVAARFDRWRFAELDDEPRDMIVLTALMGVVAILMMVATVWSAGASGGTYDTRLELQHQQWLAEQAEAEQSPQDPVVTAQLVSMP